MHFVVVVVLFCVVWLVGLGLGLGTGLGLVFGFWVLGLFVCFFVYCTSLGPIFNFFTSEKNRFALFVVFD